LPGQGISFCDVRIEEGVIREIGPNLQSEVQIEAGGSYLLPGLIDLHTHGIGLQRFSTGSLSECAVIEASCGATTFYPGLVGQPEKLVEQLKRHRQETDELRLVPQVPGFRLEGPYFAKPGGGLLQDIVKVTPETTANLVLAGNGHIKIWDVSPELPGVVDLISNLIEKGIICSIGHTSATIAETRKAVEAGATLVTHFFDTFDLPKITDQGVYPAGITDYLMVEDQVTCEIIADGTHVHPLLVEAAFRCKTANRIALVTDANLGSGLPAGVYNLPEGRGRVLIQDSNKGVRLIDRDMGLAGSALTPIDVFRNAVRLFGKSISVASQVCSATPARLMGLNKGIIAVGRDADLIILDQDFQLLQTIVAGKTVYQK
jgi:N-acetylglucosamine-6-phosphate deacetylase